MEEILASIRRIIADDQDPAPDHDRAASPPEERSDEHVRAEPVRSEHVRSEHARPEPAGRSFVAPGPRHDIDEPQAEEPSRFEHDETQVAPQPSLEIEVADVLFASSGKPVPSPVEMLRPHGPAVGAERERPETLISNEATASVGQAFNVLSHTILSQNARTLEDLVKELLKPMLRGWLDDNLPPLVERLVRAEIERVARGRN